MGVTDRHFTLRGTHEGEHGNCNAHLVYVAPAEQSYIGKGSQRRLLAIRGVNIGRKRIDQYQDTPGAGKYERGSWERKHHLDKYVDANKKKKKKKKIHNESL